MIKNIVYEMENGVTTFGEVAIGETFFTGPDTENMKTDVLEFSGRIVNSLWSDGEVGIRARSMHKDSMVRIEKKKPYGANEIPAGWYFEIGMAMYRSGKGATAQNLTTDSTVHLAEMEMEGATCYRILSFEWSDEK